MSIGYLHLWRVGRGGSGADWQAGWSWNARETEEDGELLSVSNWSCRRGACREQNVHCDSGSLPNCAACCRGMQRNPWTVDESRWCWHSIEEQAAMQHEGETIVILTIFDEWDITFHWIVAISVLTLWLEQQKRLTSKTPVKLWHYGAVDTCVLLLLLLLLLLNILFGSGADILVGLQKSL